MAVRKELLGADARQLQPKLRMVANGSTTVNAIRCEQSAALAVVEQALPDLLAAQAMAYAAPVSRHELPAGIKRGTLKEVSSDILANVFVETVAAGEAAARIPGQTARKGDLITATMSLADLRPTAENPDVAWIEAGETLAVPRPRVTAASAQPPGNARRVPNVERHNGGAGVIVGIIDVAGFDFAHPDFLDPAGNSRFLRIWDQGGVGRPSPHARDAATFNAEFAYGSEIHAEDMNRAIAAAST